MNEIKDWRAHERARNLEMYGDAHVDVDGVPRWNSNGRVPPKDIVLVWAEAGKPVNISNADKARDVDTTAFLKDYRKARLNRTHEQIAEERMEARAAMGPGVEMVNVITGERYRT